MRHLNKLMVLGVLVAGGFSGAQTVKTGEVWQVAGHAPLGWVSHTIKVGKIGQFSLPFSLNNVLSRLKIPTGPVIWSSVDQSMLFRWVVNDVEYACLVKKEDQIENSWKGTLWAGVMQVGQCEARQGAARITAPKDLPEHPLNNPTPLAENQKWLVVSDDGKISKTINIIKFELDGIGGMSSLDKANDAGLFLFHYEGKTDITFIWGQDGVVYKCESEDVPKDAIRFEGKLMTFQRKELGKCVAELK